MGIERLGVDPNWLKAWKAQSLIVEEGREDQLAVCVEALEYYARSGKTPEQVEEESDFLDSNACSWEGYLQDHLKAYGSLREFEFEQLGISEGVWNRPLAATAFAASYFGEMIDIWTHGLFPVRFGYPLQMMDARLIPYTALGVVIGAREQAFRLGMLQSKCYKAGLFNGADRFPIFIFILKVLCDFLETDFSELGEAEPEPILDRLFEVWRESNLEIFSPAALAACDFHTHRCGLTKNGEPLEFDIGEWMRLPIEILLLFKLRSMIGLANPTLDHPLMNTIFGRLPEETGFQPDELIGSVLSQMRADGFSEEAISTLEFGNGNIGV